MAHCSFFALLFQFLKALKRACTYEPVPVYTKTMNRPVYTVLTTCAPQSWFLQNDVSSEPDSNIQLSIPRVACDDNDELTIYDEVMALMFHTLESSELRGFLGVPGCADIIILVRSSCATTQPTIAGHWYSGATTQTATTISTLDLSGTTNQPANGIRLNISRKTQLQQLAQIRYSPASQKLKREMPTGPNLSRYYKSAYTKAQPAYNLKLRSKERKNLGTTIAKLSNSATTSRSFNSSIQVSKLVSIESPKEDELSATNLAPNGGVNRRKSREIGFE
ncbi:hypothetical protein F511_29840 [Dorcoceras hygrometricum]|uniref:Uncharacterized protein n=1 Tax=Dorcoceras hygrometricum TaxID=472368 RepID=A0A2Z7CGC1_9LAMI|nr:hypothetical protein F511_29840 [Dorcoceras hygrometricum]